MSDCIFCRIIDRTIPSTIVFENDRVLAFKDTQPQAPTHLLIIPKVHIERLSDLDDQSLSLAAECTRVATVLAASEGIAETGYRLVVNCGSGAGQSVWHLHYHLLGGRPMHWPPG